MIEPLDDYESPVWTEQEMTTQARCANALAHLRCVWRHLEDAGVSEQYKDVLMKLASDMKLSLGKESDGMDS